jgi:hypothetical protein
VAAPGAFEVQDEAGEVQVTQDEVALLANVVEGQLAAVRQVDVAGLR